MIKPLSSIVVTAIGYFLLGELGLQLAIPPGFASPVFPAAAVAFVAVLHRGSQILPGVWLGSFAINLGIALQTTGITGSTLWVAACIGAGACMQAWLAGALVRHRLQDAWQTLASDSDILWFLLLAGPLACLLSSSWAALTLLIAGVINIADVPFTWWNWWVGDAIGVLLFAPILLILLHRRQPLWQMRLRSVVAPILLLTLAIVATFLYVSDKDYTLLKSRIDGYGQSLINVINLQLLAYQETVGALSRLLLISPNLTHADFDRFTRPILKKHADVNALSWNPLVTAGQRSAFETRLAAENASPDFHITERDAYQQLIVAKPRDWYVVVGYIEPFAGNGKALGYDIASNPERLIAIHAAMQSKQLTATPPIRLVQDNSNLTGLLLLQPVYDEQTQTGLPVGFTVGVFKVEAMLKQQVSQNLPIGLSFSAVDLGADAGSRALYRNDSNQTGAAALSWTQTLDFAGRTWQISVHPSAGFLASQHSQFAWTILALGLIAASLLQAMLLGTTGRNFVIQRRVEQQTQEISEKNAILLKNEQHLRQEKEKYETLMHASGDGIHVLDLQGTVVEANQKFCDLLGYSHDEVIGMSVTQWDAYFDPEAAEFKVSQNFEQANIFETRHRRKTGEVIDVEISAKAVMIGGQRLLWNSSRDISERKRLLRELEQAKDVAEQTSQLKTRFLANMSHEIRTPMNGIIGLTQLALDNEMNSELRGFLNKILLSARTMLSILNDVLDISKIEAGRMAIEHAPFDLGALLTALQNLFEVSVREKGLQFQIDLSQDTPQRLLGDTLRLQQVLTNFLGNALKFTHSGTVRLSVRVLEREASQVRIAFSITDTGIGIDSHVKEQLFRPFSQLDSSISRRFGGTGLGLAICHDLVALMGGEIKVDSQPGLGSTFSFDLWFDIDLERQNQTVGRFDEARQSGLTELMAEKGRGLAGLRVLVAEDNAINQLVVCKFLTLIGMRYEIALNGEEALALLEKQTFDVVLMDVGMPVMDGVEATRRIRLQSQWRNLPIIALSAGITEAERKQCLVSGMNGFLAKPIDPEAFVETLSRCLKS